MIKLYRILYIHILYIIQRLVINTAFSGMYIQDLYVYFENVVTTAFQRVSSLPNIGFRNLICIGLYMIYIMLTCWSGMLTLISKPRSKRTRR